MPYFISNKAEGCSGWATVKADGEVLGCHKTKTQAIAQMIALSLAEDIKPGSSSRAVSLTPPAYMRAAARRGLELNREGAGGDGLKQKTIREARNMAAGNVSEDKWRRIGPWIARHLVDLDAPKNSNPDDPQYPGPGLVAHLLWGSGPSKARAIAAMNYAMNLVEKLDENKRHLPGGHDQLTHGSGGGGGGERKYVKGRNLLDSELQNENKFDIDTFNKISKWDGTYTAGGDFKEDGALEAIADKQGFTGKPLVANSQKEYDELPFATIEKGSSLEGKQINELHRGLQDSKNITADKAIDEFKNGGYWAGKGVSGNGIYTSENKDYAKMYTTNGKGEVLSFKLNPKARVATTKDMKEKIFDANLADITLPASVRTDVGRLGAALGYDALVISDTTSANPFNVSGSASVIILNRTAVILPPKG